MERMQKCKSNWIVWSAGGGTAFWLPPIVLCAIYQWRVNPTALNVVSLTGLLILAIAARLYGLSPKWGMILLGIYVLGPTAMLIAASFSRLPSSQTDPNAWLWLTVLCLFPPATLWFSLLNGMIISVLIATTALLLLWVKLNRADAMNS